MTFKEMYEAIEGYVRIQSNTDTRAQIKIFINESVLEFAKFFEWTRLQKRFSFTTGKTYDITDVTIVGAPDDLFHIAGNYIFKYQDGNTITISGSTGNDGDYTVNGTPVYNSGNDETEIKVLEDIPDGTADGSLTDESTTYDLPSDFQSEIALMTEAGVEYEKLDYPNYLEDTTNKWTIYGSTFIMAGEDADLYFLYITKGDPYPLSNDSDESEVLIYYWDIIKQWGIVKFLEWYGDDKTLPKEQNKLRDKLVNAKQSELRARKKGKVPRISVHNR